MALPVINRAPETFGIPEVRRSDSESQISSSRIKFLDEKLENRKPNRIGSRTDVTKIERQPRPQQHSVKVTSLRATADADLSADG